MQRVAVGSDLTRAWKIINYLEARMNEPGAFVVILPRPDKIEIHTANGHQLPPVELKKVRQMLFEYTKSEEK